VISVSLRDGVRISNRVRRRVKLVNYSLITALPIATSANPLFTRGLTVDIGFGLNHGLQLWTVVIHCPRAFLSSPRTVLLMCCLFLLANKIHTYIHTYIVTSRPRVKSG